MSIQSNTGDVVTLPAAGVTCIVGGNNVGKSQILRDVGSLLADTGNAAPLALGRGIVLDKVAAPREDLEGWLERIATRQPTQPGVVPQYAGPLGGMALTVDQVASIYASNEYLGAVAQFFVWQATAGALVGQATGGMGLPTMAAVGGPIARLFRDGALERELSLLSNDVFGFPLTLDRINGDVRLRVGRSEVPVPRLDSPTIEYAESVARLPLLESQGDGVKSFMGFALAVVGGDSQILLVDEPEAFLHPAQARALGRWVAAKAQSSDKQVIVATHDRDFVLGLLDAQAPVTLVRVTREGSSAYLHQLPASNVAEVWADPVLRYSNVLQGLFHSQVVVCEADADCRFYGAVLDVLATEQGKRALADDSLLVPSGGKQRAATLIDALRELGVAAHAILDFDVLRTRADVRQVLTALDETWTQDDASHYRTLSDWANATAGAWDVLKHQGVNGLPSGNVHVAGRELLASLALRRLHIVPVGEMEDFDKGRNLHGAAWVSWMLEAEGHKTNGAARTLVAPLLQ